ncbi:ribose-phosphate pyrophosphokinase [Candidatus Woesearchaeota archaeon]|nr:ribose-phosphate pyrophosphokinase [Candidatus Woesearchaeota archaeon]
MESRGELALFAGRSGAQLAERVARELTLIYEGQGEKPTKEEAPQEAITLWNLRHKDFKNGEFKTTIGDNVRGKDVFYVQVCDDPTSKRSLNDNLMEMYLTLYALKHSGRPRHLTAVIPNFPYARQDHVPAGEREPLSVKFAAQTIAKAGADHVVAVDLHSKQALLAFSDESYVDNLTMEPVIVDYLRKEFKGDLEKVVVVSPDVGGATRVESIADYLGLRVAVAKKKRTEPGVVGSTYILDKVRGYNAVIVDDIIDTGGTVEKTVHEVLRKGATGIMVMCTHPIFSGPAADTMDRLYQKGKIRKVVATDTVPYGPHFLTKQKWFDQISIAPMLAQAIFRIDRDLSVSGMLTAGVPLYRPAGFYKKP